jgi:hypothetical protein
MLFFKVLFSKIIRRQESEDRSQNYFTTENTDFHRLFTESMGAWGHGGREEGKRGNSVEV